MTDLSNDGYKWDESTQTWFRLISNLPHEAPIPMLHTNDLTSDQVAEIVRLTATMTSREIARHFGISSYHIYKIVKQETNAGIKRGPKNVYDKALEKLKRRSR